jgi:hypothetical protein
MPNDEPTLRELMDACRAGSADLELPEMGPLAEQVARDSNQRETLARSQRWDAEVEQAVRRGAVPDGLAEKLLEAVAAQATANQPSGGWDALESAVTATAETSAKTTRLSARHRPRWQTWAALATSLAAVALVAAVIVRFWPADPGQITEQQIRTRVLVWASAVNDASWSDPEFPAEYPRTRYVPLRRVRWQALPDGVVAKQVVCYDLTGTAEDRILLFVFEAECPVLPSRPTQPIFNTQGLCVGAWNEQGLVYALYVEGDSSRYDLLIRSAQGIARAASWSPAAPAA